jgi:HPt (histidine-containing phosphotransfer) domain-containing protein
MTNYNLIDTTSATAQQFEQLFRERKAYRDALIGLVEELREEVMPKMRDIYARLHGGSDAMRDEGHKLWLLEDRLTFVCNSLVKEDLA